MSRLTSQYVSGIVLSFFLIPLTQASSARPDKEMVVESTVTDQATQKTLGKTVTIYLTDRRVFDWVEPLDAEESKPEMAVFDFSKQQVHVVRDGKRCTIPLKDVLSFDTELCSRAAQRKGLGEFLSRPKFDVQFDPSTQQLTLTSPWVVYQVDGTKTTPAASRQLAEFADWSARLASLLHPSAIPSPARVELNKAMTNQNWRPDRISRRGGKKGPQLGDLTTVHLYRESLETSDRQLMTRMEQELTASQAVTLDTLQQAMLASFQESHRVGAKEAKKSRR